MITPLSPPKSPDTKHKVTGVPLEYEIVTQQDLASCITMEYKSMVLPYDTIIRNRQIPVNKSDTSFNESCKSVKGILVLFEEEKPYKRDTRRFYNPKIEKVLVIIKGKPDQLYAQGMRSFEQYDEICKYVIEGKQRDANANEVQKQLQLYDLSAGEYLTDKYAIWLDFRTIDENVLHGMGRGIRSIGGGIAL